MAIINGFFTQQAVAARNRQEGQQHRIAMVCQVWKNSRKVFTPENGNPFVTFRARIAEMDAEKGAALGITKGENVRLRFFEDTPISSTGGLDPFASKQYYLACWVQLDSEKFQGKAYEVVNDETGEVMEKTPEPVTQGRIRGGAFGSTVEEALANMDQLAAELKAIRHAKAEKKEEVPF
jgi:predicted RNase H-like HicB family nuclease